MSGNKILTLIGFAQRAGAVASGETAVKIALQKREARLLIVADDAADQTRASLIALAQRNRIHVESFGSKDALGRAIGKSDRSAVAIKDAQLAAALRRILQEEN